MVYKNIDTIELKFKHNSKNYTLGIKNISLQGSITGAMLPAGTFYLKNGKSELATAWNYSIYKQTILNTLEQQQSEVAGPTLDELLEVLIKSLQ